MEYTYNEALEKIAMEYERKLKELMTPNDFVLFVEGIHRKLFSDKVKKIIEDAKVEFWDERNRIMEAEE